METLVQMPAHAKINLYLGVRNSVDDRGYHRVDSLMTELSLADEVTVEAARALELVCLPEDPCPAEKNIAYLAAKRLGDAFGIEPRYRITLRKHVPAQAGLGGGSSDAAAVIRALCKLWDKDPLSHRAIAVARSLGADVPFFLYGAPALLGGAGDVQEQLFSPLRLELVLVRAPGPGVSTRAAYQDFDRNPTPIPSLAPVVRALETGDRSLLVRSMANNLGPVARRLMPVVDEVCNWLEARREVERTLVCGSGSCVLGVCPSAEVARAVAQDAADKGWWSCAVHTR